MKNWLDMPMNRQRLAWGMGAGLMAMMLMLLAVVWLNSLSVLPGQALLVRPQVLAPWAGPLRRCWHWNWLWALASGCPWDWRCRPWRVLVPP